MVRDHVQTRFRADLRWQAAEISRGEAIMSAAVIRMAVREFSLRKIPPNVLCCYAGAARFESAARGVVDMLSDRRGTALDPDLQRHVEEIARADGISPAEVVRDAVQQFVARNRLRRRSRTERTSGRKRRESVLDLLVRFGLVGKHRRLPRDLSTNPKHMRGFGAS